MRSDNCLLFCPPLYLFTKVLYCLDVTEGIDFLGALILAIAAVLRLVVQKSEEPRK